MSFYQSGRRTAIVMVTAMGDKSDIVDCAKVGIQGYIVKPFKQDKLAGELENYYSGKYRVSKVLCLTFAGRGDRMLLGEGGSGLSMERGLNAQLLAVDKEVAS